MAPTFQAGARIYNHPKLSVIEKTVAVLLIAAPDLQTPLRQKIALFNTGAHQAGVYTGFVAHPSRIGCAP